jgi:hypothetical protein
MDGETKRYSIPEKNFLRHGGMRVGDNFMDHGKAMRIIGIGKVYVEDRVRLIDIKATEINHSKQDNLLNSIQETSK